MNKCYLTDKNITKKANNWLSCLDISKTRLNKFKFKAEKSALLVIDMQEFFLNETSHAYIPASKAIIPRINSLIKEYKKQKLPVIFTYHAYEENEDPGVMNKWWGDVLRTTNPLSRIDKSIDYNEDDILIQKKRYSAFIGTDLDSILKEKNVEKVVITGVMTHLCCETTARDAFMKDYEVYFCIDATATDTEQLHLSSLITLSDGFAIPVKTDSILQEVR